MKKSLQILITLLLTTASFAQTFTADGLEYNVISVEEDEVEVTGGTFTNPLTIPATVTDPNTTITYTVTTVGNSAFRGRGLTGLVLPNTLTTIAFRAFRDTSNLTSITLPASVTSIGVEAFSFGGLQVIICEGSIPPNISAASFSNEEEIAVIVPVGRELFYLVSGWKGFDTINGQDPSDFLAELIIDGFEYGIISFNPNEAEVVSNTNTGAVIIPATVSFSGEIFTIASIGKNAFQFDGLTSVTIPNTVRVIDDFAFRNNDLTNLDIPDSVTFIGRDAFNSNDLVQVTIPNSVTTIENFAFNANNLTSVTIPISLTAINTEVFARNDLTSITIPTNITSIGVKAFFENNLNSVTVESNTPPSVITDADNDSFDDRSEINLFIPEGTTQAYLDTGWTGFQSVIEVPQISLEIKVFLQGAAANPNVNEEGLMRNDLSIAGLIPTTSPYQDEFIVSEELLEAEEEGAIVDWVFVELLDVETNGVVGGTSSLLRRDGFLFTPNFETALEVIEEGSYLMRISHRNHISIQTANPITLDFSAKMFFDFTTDSSFVEGGENALTEVSEGLFAMIAGDFDENGQVQPSDVNDTTAAIGTSSYSNADMDMNGQIQPADVNNLVNPNVGRGVQF